MRRNLVFDRGTDRESRYRVSLSLVRRDVSIDVFSPTRVDDLGDSFWRSTLTVEEAEQLLGALAEAVGLARSS